MAQGLAKPPYLFVSNTALHIMFPAYEMLMRQTASLIRSTMKIPFPIQIKTSCIALDQMAFAYTFKHQ